MHMIVVQIMALLVAITLHEMAHGWMAHRQGDMTPRLHGRLSASPLAHIDLFGTIIFPLLLILMRSPFLLGWAKPVPVNPAYFRTPRRGWALVSLAGPAANLAVAVVAAFLLKIGYGWLLTSTGAAASIAAPIGEFLLACVSVNVLLAVFNLIPIPPLDGGHFLEGFLPEKLAREYRKIEPFGMIIIFLLIYLGLLNRVLAPLHFQIVSLMLR